MLEMYYDEEEKVWKEFEGEKVTVYLEPGVSSDDLSKLIKYGKRYKEIPELINKTISDYVNLKDEPLHLADKLTYGDILYWIKEIFEDFGILIITEEDKLKSNEIEGSDLTSGFIIKIRQ